MKFPINVSDPLSHSWNWSIVIDPKGGKSMRREVKDPGAWVEKVIKDFINSPDNTLRNTENDRAWDEPLIGFSSGDDPLYEAYKEHVGPFHFTPSELFGQTFPQVDFKADELTVISWVLPQMEKTKADDRKETQYPSESWVRARIFGEEVNAKLRRHVVEALREAGIEAVSPLLSPLWSIKDSPRFVFASSWSERHAAFAGGLGTFGLCDGLITPRGKAMRVGSTIAHIKIPATPRPYSHYREYCLFFSKGGICGKCIQRCPAKALSKEGHDKLKCKDFLDSMRKYVPEHYGFEGYGCGFCQTGVPCESRIPNRDSE
jgi:epoxyqueuosine reductase